MSGEVLQSDTQQVPEHGHVDGQSSEIVGEVALWKYTFDQVYHYLRTRKRPNSLGHNAFADVWKGGGGTSSECGPWHWYQPFPDGVPFGG